MKTINLKDKAMVLSKDQMKSVIGGNVDAGAGKYQCCPGPGDGGITCSDCLYYSTTPKCTLGTLTKC